MKWYNVNPAVNLSFTFVFFILADSWGFRRDVVSDSHRWELTGRQVSIVFPRMSMVEDKLFIIL